MSTEQCVELQRFTATQRPRTRRGPFFAREPWPLWKRISLNNKLEQGDTQQFRRAGALTYETEGVFVFSREKRYLTIRQISL